MLDTKGHYVRLFMLDWDCMRIYTSREVLWVF